MAQSRWVYRLRQGLMRIGLALRPTALDEAPARRWLAPQALALYASMAPGDRAHGLCVLARLESQGEVTPWLAEAALLHDVGKAGARLSLAYRAAIVLLGSRLPRWAKADPASWRYPFHAHLEHARRGADLCAQAGCDPRAVALVRWHEAPPAHVLEGELQEALAALLAADDQC